MEYCRITLSFLDLGVPHSFLVEGPPIIAVYCTNLRIEKEDVKIVCVTKLGGFYDSDNHVLMEVTDPKLYFQYNVFVAILYLLLYVSSKIWFT